MPRTSDQRPPPDGVTRSALGRAARGAGPDCLDAETLAAFYERSLDAGAMARAEAHVATCLACQDATVALARSEPGPAAAAARPAWFPWRLAWAAPVLVAGLAVAVWYLRPPDVARRDAALVASRAVMERPAEPPPAARPAPTVETVTGAATAGQPAAAPEVHEETAVSALGRMSRDTAPTLVAGPGGRRVWRFGPGGAIARSDDGGSTWRDQTTVDGEPLAGSAPSPTVCWAAGRGGAVWRTIDGERWEAVARPDGADLAAVEATGADQAIVTAGDGRRWETVDGGRTWFEKGE